MKLIDRTKFELIGHNFAVKCNKDDKRYGLVYRCDKNMARFNPIEYIWFNSEMQFERKANIGWFLVFLVCPWVWDLYWVFKDKMLNLDMPIGDFINFIFIILCTFTGLGILFSIFFSIYVPRTKKKDFLKIKSIDDLNKKGVRNYETDNNFK